MTSEQQRCSDCERTKVCYECKWKDVVIPTRLKLDIQTYKRLCQDK